METTRCFETAPEGSSLAACSLPAGHEGQHRAHFEHNPEGAFIEWSNEDCATLRARAEQAERRLETREDQLAEIAGALGCEEEWTSAHDHGLPGCWAERIAHIQGRAEQAERERDEARAEVERLRDRLQTVVDEQVSPHETLPAEELITLLEHSLAEGRHERERLRQALAALAGVASGEAKACGKRSVGGDICTRPAGHGGPHHCVVWGVEAPEKAREP